MVPLVSSEDSGTSRENNIQLFSCTLGFASLPTGEGLLSGHFFYNTMLCIDDMQSIRTDDMPLEKRMIYKADALMVYTATP